MSEYYTPQRVKNLYDPKENSARGGQAFKLSRSKIELFLQCQRCFYYDRRLGVGRPPGFPFALNSAVDHLLKLEFDIHRAKGTKHPLIEKYGVDARPVPHENLEAWRHNFTGVQYLHKPTNLLITGAIDDLWQNSKGEYIVVDYKSTSKSEEITELNKDWQIGYKRQMEVYQWLLRQNGYKVSDTGYFVYCNGQTDRKAFDVKLEFDITLIAYQGDDSWVEKTIKDAYKCLNSGTLPNADKDCDYCGYISAIENRECFTIDGRDVLYETAKEAIMDRRTVSTSFLQRALKIGYARTAMILGEMEKEGIVGPTKGAKPREILQRS